MPESRALSKFSDHFSRYLPLSAPGLAFFPASATAMLALPYWSTPSMLEAWLEPCPQEAEGIEAGRPDRPFRVAALPPAIWAYGDACSHGRGYRGNDPSAGRWPLGRYDGECREITTPSIFTASRAGANGRKPRQTSGVVTKAVHALRSPRTSTGLAPPRIPAGVAQSTSYLNRDSCTDEPN